MNEKTQFTKPLKEVLPPCAFFGNGSSVGPQIFMIDDSISERLAIEKAWPSATILLCTFHFLQRRWTWLHDGKNGVTAHSDRLVLIKKLQNLVYASNEEFLIRYYNELLEKHQSQPNIPVFYNTSDLYGRNGMHGHIAIEQACL